MAKTIEGENPLSTLPVSKLLIQFAIPSVLSMLVEALYNMVDQIFIGRGVGYLGITATTVAFPLVSIILSVSTLLGIGGSVYVSIRLGAGKNEEAEKTLGTVFTLATVIGILFTVFGSLFLEPIVRFFGATDGALPYVLDYTSILLIGAPFSMIAISLSSIARADGSPLLAMNCFLVGAVLNLILDPIYIFVLGWGVRGAAIATVSAQILSAVILVVYFLKKGRIRLKAKNVLPTPSICKQIFVFGLPACMIQVATALLQIVLNNTIVFYGTGSIGSEAALSAMGIVLRISSVVISICVGISIGAQPIIGFNKGAGLHCRVKETIKKAVIAATVVSVGSWLVCEIFPAGILGIFGLHESEYMDFAIRCMRVYLLGMGTAGFQIVASNYYQASGQVVKAMVFSVLRPLILTVPLTLFLPRFFGIDGIFYAGATADLLTAAILAVFITNEFKKQQSVSNYA